MRHFHTSLGVCIVLTCLALSGHDARAQSAGAHAALSARLVLTRDAAWRSRWKATPNQLPAFVETRSVSLGQRLEILTLVIGPRADALGMANVACDVTVQRPDGSISAERRGVACLRRKVSGDAHAVYLSTATLTYVSEATDQKGRWKVKVRVRDMNAGEEVTLEDAFDNR